MINNEKVGSLIYCLSGVLNFGSLGWNPANYAVWEKINRDWKTYYFVPENREVLAKEVLKDLSKRFAERDINEEDIGDYKEDFERYINRLKDEAINYRYNTADKHVFFSYTRRDRCLALTRDAGLRNALYDIVYISGYRLSKEELVKVIETYAYVFCYVLDNIVKREINAEELEKIGLPVDFDQLKAAIETCESLGELFSWSKTNKGFEYWAVCYLDRPEMFKNRVYEYLNTLHPKLRLKFEKVQPKSKTQFTRTDYVVQNTAAGRGDMYNLFTAEADRIVFGRR